MQKGNGWNKRMMMVHTLKSRELLDHQGVKRRKGGEKPFHTKIQPWFQEGCCIDENGRWHRCDVAGNHNTECHPAYIDQSDKCKHTLLAYHIITGVVFFWSHLYSHLYFVWKRATPAVKYCSLLLILYIEVMFVEVPAISRTSYLGCLRVISCTLIDKPSSKNAEMMYKM